MPTYTTLDKVLGNARPWDPSKVNHGTAFGAGICPHSYGILTGRTRYLLAGGVRMGTIIGDTGHVHGPESFTIAADESDRANHDLYSL